MCFRLITYTHPQSPPMYIKGQSGTKELGNFLRDIDFIAPVGRNVYCLKTSSLKYTHPLLALMKNTIRQNLNHIEFKKYELYLTYFHIIFSSKFKSNSWTCFKDKNKIDGLTGY